MKDSHEKFDFIFIDADDHVQALVDAGDGAADMATQSFDLSGEPLPADYWPLVITDRSNIAEDEPLRDIWFREGAFAYNREHSVSTLGGFCKTCDYAEICRGGCTWTCYAEGGFVRDNPYCYWRQLKEKEAREAAGQTAEPDAKTRLRIVD